tara:strand:- start:544 stop:687 length:144 start_codon:yes stop_codon:yes gene_type:complete
VLNQILEGIKVEERKKENRNGKGGAYRVPIGDEQYKFNYDKIFRKKK